MFVTMIVTKRIDRNLNTTYWMKNLCRVRKGAKSLISFKNGRHSFLFKERYVFNGLLGVKTKPYKTKSYKNYEILILGIVVYIVTIHIYVIFNVL